MIRLEFYPPSAPWSINQERSKHWSWRAKRTRFWRDSARLAAVVDGVEVLPPSNVKVHLPFETKARRDPMNFIPAVKAVIDGLVEAGCWPDDTPEWVTVIEPVVCVGAGLTVVVEIESRG